jgi:hypothetical protein
LGLALYKTTTTGFTWGYYLAPRVTAFHIISLRSLLRFNPFGVGALQNDFHRFHLWLLSRSARYCVSYSTPFGVGNIYLFNLVRWPINSDIYYRDWV